MQTHSQSIIGTGGLSEEDMDFTSVVDHIRFNQQVQDHLEKEVKLAQAYSQFKAPKYFEFPLPVYYCTPHGYVYGRF